MTQSQDSRRGALVAARFALTILLFSTACGQPTPDPVQKIVKDLERYPEYSVVIEDLNVEDGFFPDYSLRLALTTAAGQRLDDRDTLVFDERVTDWIPVSEGVFSRYQHYLGMVVASRTLDGQRSSPGQAHPPGYQYVGNSQYGQWGGGGFWQFYGQYAFMSSMLGSHRVGRGDYDNYRSNRERGRPHYGPVSNGRQTFGTAGTRTQTTKPAFYQRYRQRTASGRGFTSRSSSRSGSRSGK